MSDGYTFEGLPLDEIRPGTSVLVAGPTHAGTRNLALRMLDGGDAEASIIVTTNQRAARLAEDCERVGFHPDPDRVAVIDCVGEEDEDVAARVVPVSGPADLTGIGMRYSKLSREFRGDGFDRVRTGVVSVSTLVSFGELRSVARFIHTMVGHVNSVDGLGVLFIDPSTHDERTVNTLAQFCGGRIEVRDGEEGPELRARGLADQPREWTAFDPTGDG
jgi:KaiC/GvpD/RAD55 family RecA-like ATPase